MRTGSRIARGVEGEVAIRDSQGTGYLYIRAMVYPADNYVEMVFQLADQALPEGRGRIESNDIADWTKGQVREEVAAHLDIKEGVDEIEVAIA